LVSPWRGQSLRIGLKHRELFAWVGGMSSYLPDAEKFVPEAFPIKSNLKLLWFACGRTIVDRERRHFRRIEGARNSARV